MIMRKHLAAAVMASAALIAAPAVAQSIQHSENAYVDPRAQYTSAGWVSGAVYELPLHNRGGREAKCTVTWRYLDGRAGQWTSTGGVLVIFPGRSTTSTLRGARAGTAQWNYSCD